MTPEEMQARIEMLEEQQSLTIEGMAAFLRGNFDGPGSAKGFLLAVNPKLQIDIFPFARG